MKDVTVASCKMVEGPYVAETFPVEIKDHVVSVDISHRSSKFQEHDNPTESGSSGA